MLSDRRPMIKGYGQFKVFLLFIFVVVTIRYKDKGIRYKDKVLGIRYKEKVR